MFFFFAVLLSTLSVWGRVGEGRFSALQKNWAPHSLQGHASQKFSWFAFIPKSQSGRRFWTMWQAYLWRLTSASLYTRDLSFCTYRTGIVPWINGISVCFLFGCAFFHPFTDRVCKAQCQKLSKCFVTEQCSFRCKTKIKKLNCPLLPSSDIGLLL